MSLGILQLFFLFFFFSFPGSSALVVFSGENPADEGCGHNGGLDGMLPVTVSHIDLAQLVVCRLGELVCEYGEDVPSRTHVALGTVWRHGQYVDTVLIGSCETLAETQIVGFGRSVYLQVFASFRVRTHRRYVDHRRTLLGVALKQPRD